MRRRLALARLRTRALARLLIACVLLGPSAAAAATVFQSPLNDGAEGTTIGIPADSTPVDLNLWVRPTPASPSSSPPGTRCAGTADPNTAGDELCMWDVHVVGTEDVVFEGFAAGPGVKASIGMSGGDPILRANGGDPAHLNALPAAEPVGVLTVSAPPGGSGEVQVTGNLWVTTRLGTAPVDGAPGGFPLGLVAGDSDGDGLLDPLDNCPFVANPGQAVASQAGVVGIGCACLCGDTDDDCDVDGSDAFETQLFFLGNPPFENFVLDKCNVDESFGGAIDCDGSDAFEQQSFFLGSPPFSNFGQNCPAATGP